MLGACALPAFAGERIAFDVENFRMVELAAFDRAVGLNPLDPIDGNQVRVWYDSVMTKQATAFVVSTKYAWRCTLGYRNDNGKDITVKPGSCGTARHHPAQIARVMEQLAEMSKLDGQRLACDGVMDGWQGTISGMVDGRSFAFTIGNNNECADAVSKRIEEFTDLVFEAWKPEKKE